VALVVEDGTGVPDSNAYVDQDFVENYFMGERLARFQKLDDKDQVLVSATQLVDISYDWKSTRCGIEQGLAWPRDDVEFEGHVITGIPAAVKKAVCEAVWLCMNNAEVFSTDNQREVVRERVEGAVDISYANANEKGKNAVTRFEILDRLLKGLYGVEVSSSGSSIGSVPVERV
jgi:hypothetical protein